MEIIQNEIHINSYAKLVEFISRNDINYNATKKVVETFLSVCIFHIGTKEPLIEAVEKYIENYGSLRVTDRPIFLEYLELDVIE
jgi:predicted nucleic-acid-binding protein